MSKTPKDKSSAKAPVKGSKPVEAVGQAVGHAVERALEPVATALKRATAKKPETTPAAPARAETICSSSAVKSDPSAFSLR